MNLDQIKSLSVRANLDASGHVRGAQQIVDANNKIADSEKRVEQATETTDRKISDKVTGFERWRRSMDPLYNAQQQLATNEERLQRALAAGQIGMTEYTRLLGLVRDRYSSLTTAGQALGRELQTGADGYRRFGAVAQQAGYQIGDFAVQVASGQGVMRPFIQQGTQLISMFGPWGAVIGAAGAVVGALATNLLDFKSPAERAAEAMEKYTGAVSAADSILAEHQKLGASLITKHHDEAVAVSDLARGYASLTGEMREFETARLQLAKIGVEEQVLNLRNTAASAIDPLQGVSALVERAQRFLEIQRELRPDFVEQNLRGPSERLIAIKTAVDEFNSSAERSPEALRRVYAEFVRLGSQGGELSKELLDAAKALEQPATQAGGAVAKLKLYDQALGLLNGTQAERNRLANEGSKAWADLMATLDEWDKAETKRINREYESLGVQLEQWKTKHDLIGAMEREVTATASLETAMAGGAEAYRLMQAELKALNDFRQKGIQLTAEEEQKVRDLARGAEQNRIDADADKKRQEDYRREVEKLEQERRRAADRATDQVVDYFADAMMDRNKSIADHLRDTLRRAMYQAIAEAVLRPIIQPVVAGGMGFFNGQGGIFGTLGGLVGLGNTAPAGAAAGGLGISPTQIGGLGYMMANQAGLTGGLSGGVGPGTYMDLLSYQQFGTGLSSASASELVNAGQATWADAGAFSDGGIVLSDGSTVAVSDSAWAASDILGAAGAAWANYNAWANGTPSQKVLTTTFTGMGAALGSVVPGVGTLAGAGIGAAVGSLLSSFFPPAKKYPVINAQIGYQTSTEQALGAGNMVTTPQNLLGQQQYNYWQTNQPLPPFVPGWAWATSTIAPGTEGPVRETQNALLSTVSNLGFLYGADFAGQNVGSVAKSGQMYIFARNTDLTQRDQYSQGDALGIGAASFGYDPTSQEELDNAVARLSVVMLARAGSVANENVAKAVKNIDLTLDSKEIHELLDFAMNFDDMLTSLAGGVTDFEKAAGIQARKEVIATIGAIQDFSEKTRELGLNTQAAAEASKSAVEIMLGLKDAAPEPSEVEKALAAIEGKFSNIQPLLDMVGITVDPATLKADAIANLREGFTSSIEDQIAALLDPTAPLRKAENERYAQQLADAAKLNVDLENIHELHRLRMLEIDKQANAASVDAAQAAYQGLRDWLTQQTFSDLSSLSPEDKLAAARGAFAADIAAAGEGDREALSRLTRGADTVLQLAREMYATSTDYTNIEQATRLSITELGKKLGLPGFATGTNHAPRGWAMAGERGPELVYFQGGERVLNADRTRKAMDQSSVVKATQMQTAYLREGLDQVSARVDRLANEMALDRAERKLRAS